MFPEIPSDLTTLSAAEVSALIASVEAWVLAHSTGENTPDRLAAMAEAVSAHARLTSERDGRPVVTPPATLAELAARIVPPTAAPAPVTDAEPPPVEQVAPDLGSSFTAEQMVTAIQTAVQAAVSAGMPQPAALEAIESVAGELVLPSLATLTARRVIEPSAPTPVAISHVITAAENIPALEASDGTVTVPALSAGAELTDMEAISRAFLARQRTLGKATPGAEFDRVPVVRVRSVYPESRILRAGQPGENEAKIHAVAGPQALQAAGGPCVPVQPYYDLIVYAGAERPVRDMLAGFQADPQGNGISFLASPDLSSPGPQARVVTDGVTATNTTVTSATANFQAAGVGAVGGDVGAGISGAGIPVGAKILVVNSATSVTISAATTATATGVTVTITRLGAIGFITSAQDTAALGSAAGSAAQIAGLKPCIHVSCPAPSTVLLDAITWCLEFGNWTTRAFPQQMPAWLKLTLALWARTAEVNLLDKMSAASTQVTVTTPLMGALRSLIPQMVKGIAYFRNRNRYAESVTLRVAMPRWVQDLMVCDIIHGSGYDASFLADARALIASAFAQVNAIPGYYIDSGTGKGQYFAPGGVQGAKQGNGALTAFPSTVVWYMWPEGSYLFLDGGTLDFGMFRDASLNAQNNFRMMAETWEGLAAPGPEMMEVTSTLVASGTFAGPAYGSTTQSSPVALPSTY